MLRHGREIAVSDVCVASAIGTIKTAHRCRNLASQLRHGGGPGEFRERPRRPLGEPDNPAIYGAFSNGKAQAPLSVPKTKTVR